jgi:hypothetical protein
VNISLEEAIHIHARALKSRKGGKAPEMAAERAQQFKDTGDVEGFDVWMRVEAETRQLLCMENAAATMEEPA